MIIDFNEAVARKFLNWVSEYLYFPEITDCEKAIRPCIETLIENGIFTVRELKSELQKNNISLHEKYFNMEDKTNE